MILIIAFIVLLILMVILAVKTDVSIILMVFLLALNLSFLWAMPICGSYFLINENNSTYMEQNLAEKQIDSEEITGISNLRIVARENNTYYDIDYKKGVFEKNFTLISNNVIFKKATDNKYVIKRYEINRDITIVEKLLCFNPKTRNIYVIYY